MFALLVAPSTSRAAQGPDEHDKEITISDDKGFVAANGVRSGRGTVRNPYVISGLDLHSLTIENTGKAVRITGNRIDFLTLNFIGRNVEVARNTVGDLRVNENIERTGQPTGGRFHRNTIGSVGQIRHFDGIFERNTVGQDQSTLGSPVFSSRAVAFDGFNGARFERNTVFGIVDIQLHGHHHGSSFGKASHMHGGQMSADEHHGHHMVDHTKRYNEVFVTGNTIYSNDRYALAYLDTNHDANDRTADSEPEEALELPHTHYTRVHMTGNKLIGSGILVNVFNAEDEKHKGMPSGALNITGNTIEVRRSPAPGWGAESGIDVQRARHLAVRIASNTVRADEPAGTQEQTAALFGDGQGVLLQDLDHATVTIERLTVVNRQYGIRATDMTDSVRWSIRRLTVSGVEEPVGYDSSVANAPDRR